MRPEDFGFTKYYEDFCKDYGDIISYSIDPDFDYYDVYFGEVKRYTNLNFTIKYFCPSCGAHYEFKGKLTPKNKGEFREIVCLACEKTIKLGI